MEDKMNAYYTKLPDSQTAWLEKALNELPRKELPYYVEQRILATVRERSAHPKRSLPQPLSMLRWAALTAGMVGGVYCGVLLTRAVTIPASEPVESISGFYEISDPGLLELF